MPIPTRSLSLREPSKQGPNPPSKPSRYTTTATTTVTGPGRIPKPANADANADYIPPPAAQDASNRRKSLLPQRSLGREYDAPRLRPPQQQQQQQENRRREAGVPVKELQPQPQKALVEKGLVENTTRRRSLMMRPGPGLRLTPSPLKMGSTSTTVGSTATTTSTAGVGTDTATRKPPVPTTPKSATFAPRSASPRKRDLAPASPRKVAADTSMPPPPRPNRSASLRQPLVAGSGTGTGIVGVKGHVRHRSQVIALSTGQTRRSESQSSGSVTGSTATATGSRGTQFTTYQQQFSPKKVGKPSSGTGMGTPAEESALLPATWPEIATLQTELLQLSLLHSTSVQRTVQAEAESQAQLRATYGAVAKRYRAMVGQEKNSQRMLNGLALDQWLAYAKEHNGRQGFAAQIQVFSQVVQEVCDLTDARDGRYTRLVQAFEDWYDKSQAIESMRLHCQPGDSSHLVFIDPLGPAWKDEVYAMMMKLEQCARQLQSLDILGYAELAATTMGESALLRAARGLDDMLTSMVEELRTIRRMETAVVKSERQWVSQLTGELTATHTHTHTHAREARGPRAGMWRTALFGC
ncbi:uncharacterized protein ACLA_031460 [Aspergillus clavatus NRRL 1]|uniref:Uncharacterized protein n=1 Tax=Aspergillus clavatus (strain ATCC 1007 / CBS 513.65 / DSM 816 / NCTC 3887 / NRRL 1 / QM 1276 / 107) TaxID=344612 RepID=A1CRZ2_ASPCL|nr:uncharacterized protein ACLA_031460 [Aspergillus clavatus NRRL 1]EAW08413.1 conserved hypothetical protein [Aspergillus clavatus NRRL 1]